MNISNELNGAVGRVQFFRDRLAEKVGTGVSANQFPNEIRKLSTLDGAVRLIDRSIGIASLPTGLTSIGANAFYECSSLALSELPAGLTSIGTSAFYGCTGLTAITFLGTPSGTISSNAFSFCSNLLEIKVPWASGAKAGAPWGAVNASITYNYTP